jgi:hypothetical protein
MELVVLSTRVGFIVFIKKKKNYISRLRGFFQQGEIDCLFSCIIYYLPYFFPSLYHRPIYTKCCGALFALLILMG